MVWAFAVTGLTRQSHILELANKHYLLELITGLGQIFKSSLGLIVGGTVRVSSKRTVEMWLSRKEVSPVFIAEFAFIICAEQQQTGRQADRPHKGGPLLTCAAPLRTASLESVFRKSPYPFQNDTGPCIQWPPLADIPDSLLSK